MLVLVWVCVLNSIVAKLKEDANLRAVAVSGAIVSVDIKVGKSMRRDNEVGEVMKLTEGTGRSLGVFRSCVCLRFEAGGVVKLTEGTCRSLG